MYKIPSHLIFVEQSVHKVTVSDVCGLNFVGYCLCLFKNGGSGILLFVSVSLSWFLILMRLKCTKHIGPNGDVVQ
jgi:hypothetical protein